MHNLTPDCNVQGTIHGVFLDNIITENTASVYVFCLEKK